MASRQVQDACERLTAVFIHAVPRQQDRVKGRKRQSQADIATRVEAGLKQFYDAAFAERERHRLGVIARARVAFALQQRLLAAGYSPELVKQVLFSMMLSAFVGKRR